ncbi:hypothetical protein IKG54_01050 [Candidatus Saccharibacteria bacterium]|nr:hypothetical protein [Candidatus Saccharibacteria bacterium]
MKQAKQIMWGIVLIVLGIIIGGNALGIFNLNIFFPGWWTVFILVPSAISFVTDKDKTASIIIFTIGVILLLACLSVVDFGIIWQLIIPAIIIIIGCSIIIKTILHHNTNAKIKELNEKSDNKVTNASVFSGEKYNYDEKEFKGAKFVAAFGGIDIDLSKAIIKKDVVVNASAIFGGITIKAPEDINLEFESNAIFGGVEDKRKNTKKSENQPTIYLDATTIFGGIEIK